MGTLDDAIREHLELKKRSGASEEEVKRLESEAFGPVRREPADLVPGGPVAEPDAPAAAAAAAQPLEALAPGDDAPDELTDPGPPPPPPAAAAPEPFISTPPPARPPPPERSWLEDDPEDLPPQQSTSEFTAADAADAQGRPPVDHVAPDDEGEDLLEETPDFLQETPEHDRLWFEQRPPRDFDFDE